MAKARLSGHWAAWRELVEQRERTWNVGGVDPAPSVYDAIHERPAATPTTISLGTAPPPSAPAPFESFESADPPPSLEMAIKAHYQKRRR
jgi:hypothetical protein